MFTRFSTKKIDTLLGTSMRRCSRKVRTYEEIRIPVPWGHIAGKWWGPQNKRPIMACHGWQDNCGTFDALISYLPDHLPILALDFPGHGLSSNIPSGMLYRCIDIPIFLKYIVNYFNWDKVSLLGHSIGGTCNFLYAMIYPDTIDCMLNIDSFQPLVLEDKYCMRSINSIEKLLKYEKLEKKKIDLPCYSYDVLEKMLHEGSRKSINLDKCKYILERNIEPSKYESHKYYFTRDARLKEPFPAGYPLHLSVEGAHKLTFPFFFCKARQGPYVESKNNFNAVLDVVMNVNKKFEYHNVDGTHHVHLNNPEGIAKLMIPFLEKYNILERGNKSGFKEEMKVKM